jgi:hypothetical protein
MIRDHAIEPMVQYTRGQFADIPNVTTSTVTRLSHVKSVSSSSSDNMDCFLPFGWGERFTLKHPEISKKAMEFIEWAWKYGCENNKIQAVQVERMMPLD